MFADASALVAILTGEPEGEALAALLDSDTAPITSALAVYETVLAVARKRRRGLAEIQQVVFAFLRIARIGVVPITGKEAEVAIETFGRFGKGQGHPAQLNMGDCFAYASARTAGCSLLFKGNDFSQTDIASAAATH